MRGVSVLNQSYVLIWTNLVLVLDLNRFLERLNEAEKSHVTFLTCFFLFFSNETQSHCPSSLYTRAETTRLFVSCSRVSAHAQSQNTDLVHVGAGFGGCFHVAHAPLLSSTLGLVCAHLSPVLQVRFVPHQKEGHVLVLFHTQDLLSMQGR